MTKAQRAALRKVFAGQRGTVELRLGGEDKVMSDPAAGGTGDRRG